MAGLGSRLVQHTGEGSAALRSSELKPAPDEPVADPGQLIDELVEPAHVRPRRQEQDRSLVAVERLAERHGHELPGDPPAVRRITGVLSCHSWRRLLSSFVKYSVQRAFSRLAAASRVNLNTRSQASKSH